MRPASKLVGVTAPPKNDAGGAGSVGTPADYVRFHERIPRKNRSAS